MSKPYIHAKTAAKRFGGDETPFLEISNFLDSSKAHIADSRHRALLHHSFGCFLAEKVFGTNFERLRQLAEHFNWSLVEVEAILAWKKECTENGVNIKNSLGKEVSIREIAEQHVIEDYGFIPSVQDYLVEMNLTPWMENGKGPPPSFASIRKTKYKLVD